MRLRVSAEYRQGDKLLTFSAVKVAGLLWSRQGIFLSVTSLLRTWDRRAGHVPEPEDLAEATARIKTLDGREFELDMGEGPITELLEKTLETFEGRMTRND